MQHGTRGARLLVAAARLVSMVGSAQGDPTPQADLGSKTEGIGARSAPQPNGRAAIVVGSGGVVQDPTADTPAKTGVNNTDKDAMGGATTGPGSATVRYPANRPSPASP